MAYTPVTQRINVGKTPTGEYIPIAQRIQQESQAPQEPISLTTPSFEIKTTTPQITDTGFGAMGVLKVAGGFAKDVGQATARSIASTALTLSGTIQSKLQGEDVGQVIAEPIKAEDFQNYFTQGLVETVFGKGQELKSIEQRIVEAEPKFNEWKQKIADLSETPGLNTREKFITKILSNLDTRSTVFRGIMGSVGLDLTPFGGLEKNAYKALIKEGTEEGAFILLKKMGVADDLARSFAVEVVKVSDEKGAKALFNNIVKLQENTKYTPSLYTPVAGRGGEVSKNLQTIVPKVEDVSPLAQEAPRVINGVKYNNLEEFVKAQTSATQYGDYQPALRKYGAEGYTPITKLGVKPDEMVTVYRGIDDIKGNLPRKINNGDFVTTDFDSALSYTGSPKDVVSMEVPAKYLSVSEAGDFKAEPFYTGSEYIYTKEIGNPFTKSQLTEIFNKSKRIIKGLPELPKITPTKVPQVTYKQIDEIAEKLKKKDITEKEFENLKVEIAIQKEAIDNNPAKGLTKYMSRVTGELPDVTGKPTMKSLTGSGKTVKNSEWGIRGDDIAKNIFGFEDTNSAQKALDDYLNAKARLNNVLIQTSNVRKEMAAIRRGEYLMQLAKGDRRVAYRSIQDAFNLTENELAQIRQGKDIMAMTKQEFDDFLRVAEGRAAQMAERSEARIQIEGTIFEKELKKWENLQQALKLPKISEMSTKQMKEFDAILSQYKTGDEFLPVRQIETIDNTVLKNMRTTREVKEYLAKTYNLTSEQLPPIKPHPWMYDTQLARQHPLYDLLVNRYNESYLKATGRVIEMERKSDDLIRAARKSNPEGISGKIAPTDKNVVKWLEGDKEIRATLAKNMKPEELKAAEYQDSVYHEYYDWLSKREIEKKFSSRFEDKYFPHTRRGFLEAWKEDGFLKAFGEAKDQFKQEERLLTILDEKTGDILPYQKWVGFAQFRTGGLVPTQNAAKAFKTYITALEKARQFDEFIPEIMVYVHSLTPRNLTARGVEMDDSIKRFVKSWINAKKGRVEKQIIKPGSRMDYTLRMGVALTRIRDLGLNIPVGIANIFGEQASNLTMLGAKNYSLGVRRLATSQGRDITKKYVNFVGKTLWESLSESSNTAGDKFLSGMYGLFGVASRRGNEVFLLSNMTNDEFAKGVISIERLGQLRKAMGEYRVVEGAESVFGKSVEGAIGGQYKKWAIPILTSTASNGRILAKNIRTQGLSAIKTKEGQKLFYSVVVGATIGMGTYGYYDELKNKKDRSFMEEIIFKSIRDSMTMIGALDPKFIGSFASPRLASFITDITEAIDNLLFLEKNQSGELKGVKQIERLLTPVAVTSIIDKEKAKPSTGSGLPKLGLPQLPKLHKLPKL